MKQYRVLSNIDHDNRRYGAGDFLELVDDLAAPLVTCGAIEALEEPAPELEPEVLAPEPKTRSKRAKA